MPAPGRFSREYSRAQHQCRAPPRPLAADLRLAAVCFLVTIPGCDPGGEFRQLVPAPGGAQDDVAVAVESQRRTWRSSCTVPGSEPDDVGIEIAESLLYSGRSGLAVGASPGSSEADYENEIRGSTAIHLRGPARSPKYHPDTSTPMKSPGEAPALMDRERPAERCSPKTPASSWMTSFAHVGGKSGPRRAIHVTTSPKEDVAFFVSKGTGKFTLGDEQIDTKAGDAYGVPAGTKYGLTNNGSEPVELLMYRCPVDGSHPANKPAKGSADAMEWVPNTTHGRDASRRCSSAAVSAPVIRNIVANEGQSRLRQYGALGRGTIRSCTCGWPRYLRQPPDSRTYGARVILRDRVVQARQGDAFYAGGAPRRDEHGLFDESPKEPLIYIAIGALPPGQGPGGPGGPGAARWAWRCSGRRTPASRAIAEVNRAGGMSRA